MTTLPPIPGAPAFEWGFCSLAQLEETLVPPVLPGNEILHKLLMKEVESVRVSSFGDPCLVQSSPSPTSSAIPIPSSSLQAAEGVSGLTKEGMLLKRYCPALLFDPEAPLEVLLKTILTSFIHALEEQSVQEIAFLSTELSTAELPSLHEKLLELCELTSLYKEVDALQKVLPNLSFEWEGTVEDTKKQLLHQIGTDLAGKRREEIEGIQKGIIQELFCLKEDVRLIIEASLMTTRSCVELFSKREYGKTFVSIQGTLVPVMGYLADEKTQNEDKKRLIQILRMYKVRFQNARSEAALRVAGGLIENKVVSEGSGLLAHADLHGDLKFVLGELEFAHSQGLLTEQYHHILDNYFFFLGDVLDRSCNDIETLTLLLLFHMDNPDHVLLTRGNHENHSLNALYNNDPQFFLENEQLFTDCFSTMPLAVCVGERGGCLKKGERQRQYLHCSHGLFSPAVNYGALLEGPDQSVLLPNPQFDETRSDSTEKAQRALATIRDKFNEATTRSETEGGAPSITQLRAYTWAEGAGFTEPYLDRPTLSPDDIHLCSQAYATPRVKVGRYLNGHKHHFHEYVVTKEGRQKCLLTTLPTANLSGLYAEEESFAEETLQAIYYKIHPKLKEWTKQAVVAQVDNEGKSTFQWKGAPVPMDASFG